MNSANLLQQLLPKPGLPHLLENYLTWSSVGLIGALVADNLDSQAELSYAAYYTNAVNDAVGYQFWILLAVIGLLLFCLSLPVIYLALHFPQLSGVERQCRRLAYTFFLVAFDEGALMIGILIANFLHTSERMAMLSSKSFLFSDVGLLPIIGLGLTNALLWWLGESLYNRDDREYSGVVGAALAAPLKYALPGYLLFSGIVLYLIVDQ